jgi:DNA-binding NtrC family response regulator
MGHSIATFDDPASMTADLQPELARIAALIADGHHREDLFCRLDVLHLSTPPLRERRHDVPALVIHFLGRAARPWQREPRPVTDEAMAALVGYAWPGDVRELQDVIEQMMLAARADAIGIDDVPPHIRDRHEPSDLYEAMVVHHESFWTAVYPLFMNRQITGAQVRAIVSLGLAATGGRYTEVARLFNVEMPHDYKRFLGFLDHFHCKPSFKNFREWKGRSGTQSV